MTTEPTIIELTDSEALTKNGVSINYRNLQVSEHIRIALFEATHKKTVTVINRFENAKPHIGFNFCISGATSFALTGGYPTAFADNKKVNNFLMPACHVTQELIINTNLSLLTLFVDLPAFLKIIGESLEALPFNFLDAMHTDNKCYFESYQWQAIIKNVLSQISWNRVTRRQQHGQ